MYLTDVLELIEDFKVHYVLKNCPFPADPTNEAIIACLNDLMLDIIIAWRNESDAHHVAECRRFDLFIECVKKAKERGV